MKKRANSINQRKTSIWTINLAIKSVTFPLWRSFSFFWVLFSPLSLQSFFTFFWSSPLPLTFWYLFVQRVQCRWLKRSHHYLSIWISYQESTQRSFSTRQKPTGQGIRWIRYCTRGDLLFSKIWFFWILSFLMGEVNMMNVCM